MRIFPLRKVPRVHVPAFAALLLLNLVGCDWMQMKDTRKAGEARIAAARMKRIQHACASSRTYDRLKDLAFDDAIRIRNTDPVNLDKLATYSVIRMENPRVKARDDTLDVTVCGGRFILHVPPGAERGFNGATRLEADVEYTAQAAADGSGLIYQLSGADPIIYRLAAFDLRGHKYDPTAEQKEKFAEAAIGTPADPAALAGAAAAAPAVASPPPSPAAGGQAMAASLPSHPAKLAGQAVQAGAPQSAAPKVRKPIPAVAAAPSSPPLARKATAASLTAQPARRLVQTAAAPKPDKPQVRKPASKPVAARPASARAEKAMAASGSSRLPKRADRTAQGSASRPPKPKADRTVLARAAARPAPSRAQPPSRSAQRPVQTARAAASLPQRVSPRSDMRRTSLALGRSPSAPVSAKQPTPAPPPSLSARLTGLAAVLAASESEARKATPAAAPAAPAGPRERQATAGSSRSTKPVSRSVKVAAPKPPAAQVRRTTPAVAPPPPARPRPEQSIATYRPPVRSPDPGSDCRYARSRSEEMLCRNARLASLDRSMRRLYSAALSEADSQARYELQRTRQRFLTYLDRCQTESCVARAYQGRMAEIREIIMVQ